MNLLKILSSIPYNDAGTIRKVTSTISARKRWMEDREPDSDGFKHEEWEEKCDELDQIEERLELYFDIMDDNEKCEEWEEIKAMIFDYQATYGGLSRLYI